MNRLSELFEKFMAGHLDNKGAEEMDRLMLEAWYGNPSSLSPDERDYADDLLIELSGRQELTEDQERIFMERMEKDPELHEKFLLEKNLEAAAEHAFHRRSARFSILEESEEEAEAKLREMLREIIPLVEAEQEKERLASPVEKLRQRWEIFAEQWRWWVTSRKGQVRLAISMASFLLLAGFAFLFLRQETSPPMAIQVTNPAGSGGSENTPAVSEPAATTEMSGMMRERIINLLISSFEVEKVFNSSPVRGGEMSENDEAFLKAAQHFDLKEYDSSLHILNKLLKTKAFRDRDTLDEIWFYRGNCYLAKSFRQNNAKMAGLSLQSFDSITPQSYYYKHALYYAVFAHAKLGDIERSMQLLDTLALQRYGRQGKVKMLRDSVRSIGMQP